MIFGLVNAIIKPIVQIISIPLYILTLGLIHVVINALMLWITSWITEHTTHWGLYIDDFWWTAIWAAIVLSIVSWLLSLIARDAGRRVRLDRHTGHMPELPEVEALADHLRRHAVGLTVGRIDVSALSVLKTFDPPINVLHGQTVTGANRWGKYLGLQAGDLHLITHLSRAGWLRWSDKLAAAPLKPGKGPIALRVHLGTPGRGTGFRPDRGRHAEAAGGVAGRRPGQGAGHRGARARTRCRLGPRIWPACWQATAGGSRPSSPTRR